MHLKRWLAVLGIAVTIALLTISAPARAYTQPTAQRIVFPVGATSAAVQGQVAATGTDYWVMTAQAGQSLSANLSFDSGQAILIVWGADGSVLLSDHATASTFSSVLPVTQDYFIAVRGNPSTSTSYTLNVTVPPLASPLPPARRIQMAPSTSNITVNGQVAHLGTDQWVLTASAGQILSITFTSDSGQISIAVIGADGTTLPVKSALATTFTYALSSTQDYYIQVLGNQGPNTNYALNIDIPPLFTPPATNQISFGPGGTSATVQGQVAANGMDRWTLQASAGQTMTAQLAFSTGQAILVVYGADGDVLLSDHVGASAFNGILPASQFYIIDVRGNPTASTSYSLTVTIPPLTSQPDTRRIQFALGADSAAVQGLVAANSTNTWVLAARGGQTMAVQVIYSTQPVTLSVTGADGSVLMSAQAGASSFAGVLPSTQDYIVTVKGNPSIPASYTLTVTIPPL